MNGPSPYASSASAISPGGQPPCGLILLDGRGRITAVDEGLVDLLQCPPSLLAPGTEAVMLLQSLVGMDGWVGLPPVGGAPLPLVLAPHGKPVSVSRLTLPGGTEALVVTDTRPLHLAQDTLAQIFRTAPFPMLLVHEHDRSVLRINPRASEIFPYPVGRSGGRGGDSRVLDDFIGPHTRRQFMTTMHRQGFVQDLEAQVTTLYGETLWVLLSGQRLNWFGEDCLVLGLNDITDRKILETQALQIFEVAPAWLILCRRQDGRLLRINRRASEVFGQATVPQFLRHGGKERTVAELFGADAWADFAQRLNHGGYVDDYEVRLSTEYGESLWVLLTGQLIEMDGETCVLVGANDISDRKIAEEELREARNEALRHARAKSSFLASMSHEIRTPMNGVLSALDLLTGMDLGEQERFLVTLCRDSGETLLTILNDILDSSKIEAGMLRLEAVPFRFSRVVETVCDLLSPRAREKDLEFVAWVDPALDSWLVGDPTRLRQVLLNLAGNAIKFTEGGHVLIRVGLERHGAERQKDSDGEEVPDGTATLRIDVTDTGIGMTPEQQDRLFKAYSQADDSTTRRFGGTGLGLSIAARLVEMMGGRIGVISREGQGSTFWFRITLPIAPPDEETRPDMTPADLSGIKIVIACAGETTGRVLARYCEAWGAEMVDFETPADVAVIDDSIPPNDRAALLDILRQMAPDTPPRILLLNTPAPTGTTLSKTSDVHATVNKPVHREMFHRTVAVLSGRRDPDALTAADKTRTDMPEIWQAPARHEAQAAQAIVLVAEDNETNQIVLSRFLDRLGYAHDIVADGQQALEWLTAEGGPVASGHGLLLTDLQMPVMDGFALVDAYRAHEKSLGDARLPIIALSADVLQETVDRCFAAGMNACLSKPIDPIRLEAALTEWLPNGHALRRRPDQDDEAEELEAEAAVEGVVADAAEMPPAGRKTRARSKAKAGSTAKGKSKAAAVSDGPAVLDLEPMLFIFGSITDEARTMLRDFLTSVSPLFDEARAALAVGDTEAAKAPLHAAKGAANTAGARALGALCAAVEEAVKRGDIESARRLAEEVPAAFHEVSAEVDAL